jgi:vacuolar-type H+-ATPase subunit E/Vma4
MVAAPDFAARLEPILAEALPFVAGNDTRARCAPAAEAAVRAALAGAGRGDAEVIPDGTVAAGAILENADGAMRVDATLAARLRRLRPELSIEAVRLAEDGRP